MRPTILILLGVCLLLWECDELETPLNLCVVWVNYSYVPSIEQRMTVPPVAGMVKNKQLCDFS
jgi:hypothetical protein